MGTQKKPHLRGCKCGAEGTSPAEPAKAQSTQASWHQEPETRLRAQGDKSHTEQMALQVVHPPAGSL